MKQLKDAIVFGIILSLVMTSSTAQEILLRSSNSTSKRSAFFEDDGRVAYLYLTAPGTGQLEKDVIVYMRVPPIDRAEFDALRRAKATPLLLKEVASEDAVVNAPEEREFSLRWSADGHAVAVLRHGVALAFANAEERFGYSKAVSVSSPFANSWDQVRYESLFLK